MQKLVASGWIDEKYLPIHAMHRNRLAIRREAGPNGFGIEVSGITELMVASYRVSGCYVKKNGTPGFPGLLGG